MNRPSRWYFETFLLDQAHLSMHDLVRRKSEVNKSEPWYIIDRPRKFILFRHEFRIRVHLHKIGVFVNISLNYNISCVHITCEYVCKIDMQNACMSQSYLNSVPSQRCANNILNYIFKEVQYFHIPNSEKKQLLILLSSITAHIYIHVYIYIGIPILIYIFMIESKVHHRYHSIQYCANGEMHTPIPIAIIAIILKS